MTANNCVTLNCTVGGKRIRIAEDSYFSRGSAVLRNSRELAVTSTDNEMPRRQDIESGETSIQMVLLPIYFRERQAPGAIAHAVGRDGDRPTSSMIITDTWNRPRSNNFHCPSATNSANFLYAQ